MAAAIIAASQDVSDNAGSLFLKFSKGDWSYGADQTEVETGSEWAVNPTSIRTGYQCWGKDQTPDSGTLLGERLAPIGAVIDANELPQHANGKWQPAVSLQMRCASGEDEGLQVEWGSCSVGGVKAYKEQLLAPIGAKLQAGDTACVPVVKLETDFYMHKDKAIGKVKFPVFKLVRWMDMDGEAEEVADEVVEEASVEEPKPQRRRRAKA